MFFVYLSMFCQGPFVASIIKYNEADYHGHVISDDTEIIVNYPLPLLLEHTLEKIGEVLYGFKQGDSYYVVFISDMCFDESMRLSLGGDAILDEGGKIKKLFIYEVSLVKFPAQNVTEINYVVKSCKKADKIVYLSGMKLEKQTANELEQVVTQMSEALNSISERISVLESEMGDMKKRVEDLSARLLELESKGQPATEVTEQLTDLSKSVNELVSDLIPIVKQLIKQ